MREPYYESVGFPHPTFNVVAYAIPSDLEVRGNAMASGDPAFDKEVEDEILTRLERGEWKAWFDVKVTATFVHAGGFIEASEYLGACSYPEEDEIALKDAVGAHGLAKEAVRALTAKLTSLRTALAALGDL